MEVVCPMSSGPHSSYPNGDSSNSTPSSSSAASRLQSSGRQHSTKGDNSHEAPSTPNKHVNFGGGGSGAGVEEKKREKFLTAKYGAHQMALIRKRLRVEMWMYERLQQLYGGDNIEIDLDEVLDIDEEEDRRIYISELLRVDGNASCLTSPENVNMFVGDLLEKVKTL